MWETLTVDDIESQSSSEHDSVLFFFVPSCQVSHLQLIPPPHRASRYVFLECPLFLLPCSFRKCLVCGAWWWLFVQSSPNFSFACAMAPVLVYFIVIHLLSCQSIGCWRYVKDRCSKSLDLIHSFIVFVFLNVSFQKVKLRMSSLITIAMRVFY